MPTTIGRGQLAPANLREWVPRRVLRYYRNPMLLQEWEKGDGQINPETSLSMGNGKKHHLQKKNSVTAK